MTDAETDANIDMMLATAPSYERPFIDEVFRPGTVRDFV